MQIINWSYSSFPQALEHLQPHRCSEIRKYAPSFICVPNFKRDAPLPRDPAVCATRTDQHPREQREGQKKKSPLDAAIQQISDSPDVAPTTRLPGRPSWSHHHTRHLPPLSLARDGAAVPAAAFIAQQVQRERERERDPAFLFVTVYQINPPLSPSRKGSFSFPRFYSVSGINLSPRPPLSSPHLPPSFYS